MSPRKRDEDVIDATPDLEVQPEPVVEVKPEVSDSQMSFAAYCSLKNIPERRRAGMKAFTKTVRASLSEWDNIFKSY